MFFNCFFGLSIQAFLGCSTVAHMTCCFDFWMYKCYLLPFLKGLQNVCKARLCVDTSEGGKIFQYQISLKFDWNPVYERKTTKSLFLQCCLLWCFRVFRYHWACNNGNLADTEIAIKTENKNPSSYIYKRTFTFFPL